MLHCATQEFYGRRGRASEQWLKEALTAARTWLDNKPYAVMPRIAAGLGGLDWQMQVLPIVNQIFDSWAGNLSIYSL